MACAADRRLVSRRGPRALNPTLRPAQRPSQPRLGAGGCAPPPPETGRRRASTTALSPPGQRHTLRLGTKHLLLGRHADGPDRDRRRTLATRGRALTTTHPPPTLPRRARPQRVFTSASSAASSTGCLACVCFRTLARIPSRHPESRLLVFSKPTVPPRGLVGIGTVLYERFNPCNLAHLALLVGCRGKREMQALSCRDALTA